MDQEDGLIWVYGPGDDGAFGIETLRQLVQMHKADPELLSASARRNRPAAA